MKIIVCAKRVPDTASKVKIASDGTHIDKTESEQILSPYDEIAVEHAMRVKEKNPNTEVVILTLGPAEPEKNIRTALAMGADRAILLETSQETWEAYPIAKQLAQVIASEKPDLVLTGIKSADNDNAQVGAMIASLLDMPFLTTMVALEVKDGKVHGESEIEGEHQILEASFPAVVSIQKSNVEPRISSLIALRKAKTKEIKKIPVTLDQNQWKILQVALPPERKAGKIVGQGPDAVPLLFQLLRDEAKVL